MSAPHIDSAERQHGELPKKLVVTIRVNPVSNQSLAPDGSIQGGVITHDLMGIDYVDAEK